MALMMISLGHHSLDFLEVANFQTFIPGSQAQLVD